MKQKWSLSIEKHASEKKKRTKANVIAHSSNVHYTHLEICLLSRLVEGSRGDWEGAGPRLL